MICETSDRAWSLPFDEVRDALEQTGELIADHLSASGDCRWADLLAAWKVRDFGEPVALLAWSAGLSQDVARTFAKGKAR
jgi:hypothetical protein